MVIFYGKKEKFIRKNGSIFLLLPDCCKYGKYC